MWFMTGTKSELFKHEDVCNDDNDNDDDDV
jgi:hypothetical protein